MCTFCTKKRININVKFGHYSGVAFFNVNVYHIAIKRTAAKSRDSPHRGQKVRINYEDQL